MFEEHEDLIESMDRSHREACRAQRRFFSSTVEADREGVWEDWGAHDMAHFVSMRYDVSYWRANRWSIRRTP